MRLALQHSLKRLRRSWPLEPRAFNLWLRCGAGCHPGQEASGRADGGPQKECAMLHPLRPLRSTRRPAPLAHAVYVRPSVRVRARWGWTHGGCSRDGTGRGRERRRLLARAYRRHTPPGALRFRTTATAVVARVQNNDLTELNQTRKSLTETQDALQLVQARSTACPRRSRAAHAPLTRRS